MEVPNSDKYRWPGAGLRDVGMEGTHYNSSNVRATLALVSLCTQCLRRSCKCTSNECVCHQGAHPTFHIPLILHAGESVIEGNRERTRNKKNKWLPIFENAAVLGDVKFTVHFMSYYHIQRLGIPRFNINTVFLFCFLF